MVKLTEEMVIARTRNSDLSSIKKLNCWGSDLSDVSLLRRMNNVEVLSLSVNQISTLADFQHCVKLQELYIRKNNIKNIREICYLKELQHLKNLWIADNPCAEVDGYRLTVLRNLPQLQKLDDIPVQPEEIKEALRLGKELVLPSPEEIEEEKDGFEIQQTPEPSPQTVSEPPSRKNSEAGRVLPESISRKNSEAGKAIPESVPRKNSESAIHQPLNQTYVASPQLPTSDSLEPIEEVVNRQLSNEAPRRRSGTMTLNSPAQELKLVESAPASRRSSVSTFSPPTDLPVNNWVTSTQSQSQPSSTGSPVQQLESPQQNSQRCPVHNQGYPTPSGTLGSTVPITHDPAPFLADYPTYNNPHSAATIPPHVPQPDPHLPNVPDQRYSYHDQRPFRPLSDPNLLRGYPNYQGYSPQQQQQQVPHYPGPGSERFSPTRPVGRARNRASNLLMAALCLVHELDFASLEVLAMAVRNRLDELDD